MRIDKWLQLRRTKAFCIGLATLFAAEQAAWGAWGERLRLAGEQVVRIEEGERGDAGEVRPIARQQRELVGEADARDEEIGKIQAQAAALERRIQPSAGTRRSQIKREDVHRTQDALEAGPILTTAVSFDAERDFVNRDARQRATIALHGLFKEVGRVVTAAEEIDEDVGVYAERRSRHRLHRSRSSRRTGSQSICLSDPRSHLMVLSRLVGRAREAFSMMSDRLET